MSSNSSSSSSNSSFVSYQSPTKASLRVSTEEQSTRLAEIETALSSCDRKGYLEKSNQFSGDMEDSIDVSKFAKAGISLSCYREPIA